jgi:hypothetical protein
MAGELPLYGRSIQQLGKGKKCGAPVLAMLTLYIAIIVILSVLYYISRRSSDPYGTFHLSFNRVPGNPDPPRTEWLNMGLWKVPHNVLSPSNINS